MKLFETSKNDKYFSFTFGVHYVLSLLFQKRLRQLLLRYKGLSERSTTLATHDATKTRRKHASHSPTMLLLTE